MKKITILMLLCISVFGSSEPFNYDPFSVADSVIRKHMPNLDSADESTKKSNPIVLSAIMSNRAFINGHWYKVGDKFGSYKVNMIKPTLIGLKIDNKTKIFYLGKKKKVLTIKERL